jgi:hypothetical protein
MIDFPLRIEVFQWEMLNWFQRESKKTVEGVVSAELLITYLNIGFGISEIINNKFR